MSVTPARARHADDLHLKVVVHRGPLLHYRLKDFDDLSGLAIIAARRLLKNSLGMSQYVLVTEAAAEAKVILPLTLAREHHVERYDDVGARSAVRSTTSRRRRHRLSRSRSVRRYMVPRSSTSWRKDYDDRKIVDLP